MHAFIKKNMVMVIALLAAAITSIIIPPDHAYLGYFDLKTLTCLFCVLAVVCALKNINFFYMLARKVVKCFKNARMSILALVYITFIGSGFYKLPGHIHIIFHSMYRRKSDTERTL